MKHKIKKIVKVFLPNIVLKYYYKLVYSKVEYLGPYTNWKTAKKNSNGYNDKRILKKILENSLEAQKSKKYYERDGELLNDNKYPKEITKFLNSKFPKKIQLLDFGGSLGSFYFQNRFRFQASLIKWLVYEQEDLVNVGNTYINEKEVFFSSKISELKKFKPDILLFSSVLEYLDNPKFYISEVLKIKTIKYIIIDRLLVSDDEMDKIYIQKNPKKYYFMSYPCRIFCEKSFLPKYFKGHKQLSFGKSYVGNDFFLNGQNISYHFYILKVTR